MPSGKKISGEHAHDIDCTAVSFENPLDEEAQGQDSAFALYTIVSEAIVRKKKSVKSKEVRTLEPGTVVTVYEQAKSNGHARAKIGEGEWISLQTRGNHVLATRKRGSGQDKTYGVMSQVADDCVVSFPGGKQWLDLLDHLEGQQAANNEARHKLSVWWKSVEKFIHTELKGMDEIGGVSKKEQSKAWASVNVVRKKKSLRSDPMKEILDAVPQIGDEFAAMKGKGPLAGDGIVNLACVFMDEDMSATKRSLLQNDSSHPKDKAIDKLGKRIKKHKWTAPALPRGVEPAEGHCLSFNERLAFANKQGIKCYCARLGSLNYDANCGYQGPGGFPKQGDDGCTWFKQWLENVEMAVKAGSTLHVVQKSDAPAQYWTLGQPLGHAQTLEVLTLQQLGHEFQTHQTPQAFVEWFDAKLSADDRIRSFGPKADKLAFRKIKDLMPGILQSYGSVCVIGLVLTATVPFLIHAICDETAHVVDGSDGSDDVDGLGMPDRSDVFDCLEDLYTQASGFVAVWFILMFLLGLQARKAHKIRSAVHAKLKEIKAAKGPW